MNTETRESAEVRVQRGNAYLDEKHPCWLTRINLGTLDLWHAARCIIAQATGENYLDYYDLGDGSGHRQHAIDHGFTALDVADMHALDRAWRATIAARRG